MVAPVKHLNYRPANGFKRVVAYLIDTLPIQMALYLVSMSIYGISPLIDPTAATEVQIASHMANQLIGLGVIGIWLLYSVVAELSPWHGTFGKKVMGLTVRSVSGRPMTVGQVLGRNAAKILSILPCCLGFVWAFFTHGNRAWHDSLSNTAVAERR
ncbi:MAG: RDD family protein [Luteolibacter sp.]|jgi:uncharacterized RDD family membrane protein YckC|nr:RDD family protein [Luteolibacter sp.]